MTLIRTADNRFICANCRIQQPGLRPQCNFCGRIFSNYENLIIEIMNDKRLTYDEIYDIMNIQKEKEEENNDTNT